MGRSRHQTLRTGPGAVLALRLAIFVAFVGGWEVSSRTGLISELFFSRPSAVLEFLIEEVPTADFAGNLWVTLQETIASTVLGGVSGVLIAMLLSWTPTLSKAMDPFIAMLNSMPRIALAPLFIVWFGLGQGSKIAVGTSLAFFIFLLNTEAGLTSRDQDQVTLMRIFGASRFKEFVLLSLPSAAPSIFAALRLGIVYSLLGVVAAELIAAKAGLGQAIQYYSSVFNVAGVFGVLTVLAVVASALAWLVRKVEAYALAWRPTSQ